MTNNYSPSHASGFDTVGTLTQDKLFDRNTRTRKATIAIGATHVRGELLGKVTDGARTASAAAGTPAPAGATITASPTATTAADVGVHRFVCVTAGATGKWEHLNPRGEKVGTATTGTAYTGGGLTLTITDSGTDPAVNEEFDVTVTEATASGKYLLSLAAATDGSEVPEAILLHDVDATSADAEAIIAIAGDFGIQGVTFGAGHTAASVDAGLRDKSIYLENVFG